MSVKVYIPTPFRRLTENQARVDASSGTVLRSAPRATPAHAIANHTEQTTLRRANCDQRMAYAPEWQYQFR